MICQQKPKQQEENIKRRKTTKQQADSSKQRQRKKCNFRESKDEIEKEVALNFMFGYFDKKFEGMQAQINKNVKPPVKKYKKTDGQNTKGKGNKDQLDFNTETSFAKQECQHQISRSIIEPASLTSVAANLKKIIKLIKLADRSPVGQSIVQEYEPNPMASDSDDAQKIRQTEQIAIRKKKVKTQPVLHSYPHQRSLKHLVFSFRIPVSKMYILCQSL